MNLAPARLRGMRARRLSVSALVDVHEITSCTTTLVSARRDAAAAARWLSVQVGAAVGAVPGTTADPGPDRTVLAIGPGRWLVRSDGPSLPADPPAGIAVFDQSDAWRVFRLGGIAARRLLAGGCPLDLDARRFAPGRCAATRYDKFRVLLACIAPDTCDLYAERSFADDLRGRIIVRAAALSASAEPDT
jgi:sarcosine oxidase subunit gamma